MSPTEREVEAAAKAAILCMMEQRGVSEHDLVRERDKQFAAAYLWNGIDMRATARSALEAAERVREPSDVRRDIAALRLHEANLLSCTWWYADC